MRNFRKISILALIFEKFRFWVKFSKNFDFGQIFEKKIDGIENLRKFRKISLLVKFSKKLRFWLKSAKVLKNSDFSQIFEKLRFWWNFSKISILVKLFEKFRYWSNVRKFSNLVKISISSILVTFSKKSSIFVKIFEKFGFVQKISILVKFS